MVLEKLEPKSVWQHFEKVCGIPRPSGHEEKMGQYILDFAKKIGLQAQKDKVGNVVVVKPAAKGLEKVKTIVLQSHIDMVTVAKEGLKLDFLNQGVTPKVEGEYVRATDTTLGADNGIGVAIMLSLMEEKTNFGPLEFLFTVNEEVGMDGARGLDASLIHGKALINLDTEDWGEIYISCAGGGDTVITIPLKRDTAPSSKTATHKTLELKIGGLKGGHSGCDIHLGRGSANKIIGRILQSVFPIVPFTLRLLTGGEKRNVIAPSAKAYLDIPTAQEGKFKAEVQKYAKIIATELSKTDPKFECTVNDASGDVLAMASCDDQTTKKIIDLLTALPQGVLAMSNEVPGLVETSTNIGVLTADAQKFQAAILSRSAVDTAVDAVKQQIRTIASLAGGNAEEMGGYPGWKPNKDAFLLKLAQKVYKDLYKTDAAVKAIHAGLECGLFAARFPDMEMISIGPTVHGAHSVKEEVHIPTVTKSYDYVKAILAAWINPSL